MLIILIFLLSSSVASVLVGLWLTKPLMVRGYQSLGFWGGLLALIILFGVGQYFIADFYRSSFIIHGPCSTCCELCGLTSLFWWLSWGIGLIAYLVISNTLKKRYSDITPLPTPRWLKISIPVGIFCLIVGVLGFSLWKDNSERTHLHNNIVKIENSILSGNLTEIGSIQLAQTAKYWTLGDVSYVMDMGISSDGEWLSLQYPDKIELWNLSDMTRRKVFHSGSYIEDRSAFSPDSSKFAVWIDEKLSVYALGDEITPTWKIENNFPDFEFSEDGTKLIPTNKVKLSVDDLGFSEDGKELVITNAYDIETFDANNGNRLQTVAMPGESGFWVGQLSNNSEYIVTGNNQVFRLYDRHNGQLLYEIEKPGGKLLPNNDVLFLDCTQSTVAIWDKETDNEVSFDVIGDYCWPPYNLAFTPDANISALASLHDFSLLDLKNEVQSDPTTVQPAITAIALSPDGHMTIIATADGRLNFYANMMSEN